MPSNATNQPKSTVGNRKKEKYYSQNHVEIGNNVHVVDAF